MTNEHLINRYREQLIRVHLITVAIVSLVEILAYLIFASAGVQALSLESTYLWKNVVLPICINAAAHLCVRKINRSEKASTDFKNASVIYAAFVTTFTVSVLHRDYIVTPCAFVFPIILSAMYNRRKLLIQSFWLAVASLSITAGILFLEHKLNLDTALNVLVLYGFVAVSYLSGDISIRFSKRNFSVIEDQANRNTSLENKIELDQMTKLYHHAAFYKKLEFQVSQYHTNRTACCLAMIDIDNFKSVNDTYGHDSGDLVLITMAEILKSVCERNDIACRYGGEEFAVIFSEKELPQAIAVMETALQTFSEYRFPFTETALTFSCGIAELGVGETEQEFFNRADSLLYTAKKTGKNQIVSMQSTPI